MRGQELPVNTIILIAIALVLLVFAISYIVLPIARTALPPSQNTTMSTFAFDCATTYCGLPASTNNLPSQTRFCTASVTYGGAQYHCYDMYGTKVIATCSYQAQNGTYWSNINGVTCAQH